MSELAVSTELGRSLRLRLIVAIVAAAVIAAVGGAFAGTQAGQVPVGGTIRSAHKAGHGEPPGCDKNHMYGKKPKKNCPSHPDNPNNNNPSNNKPAKGAKK